MIHILVHFLRHMLIHINTYNTSSTYMNSNWYIYKYIYIYTYIYIYIHIYIYIYIYIHIHTYIYIYIHTYIISYPNTYISSYTNTYWYVFKKKRWLWPCPQNGPGTSVWIPRRCAPPAGRPCRPQRLRCWRPACRDANDMLHRCLLADVFGNSWELMGFNMVSWYSMGSWWELWNGIVDGTLTGIFNRVWMGYKTRLWSLIITYHHQSGGWPSKNRCIFVEYPKNGLAGTSATCNLFILEAETDTNQLWRKQSFRRFLPQSHSCDS